MKKNARFVKIVFKKFADIKKLLYLCSRFSYLCNYMKKGSDFLVIKYVYRSVDGVYCRDHSKQCRNSLINEFPVIYRIVSMFPSFKLTMKKPDREITAWKDKYNNVIVRVIDKSIVQSKINF